VAAWQEAVSCRESSKWDRRWRYGSSKHCTAVLPSKGLAQTNKCMLCWRKEINKLTSRDSEAYNWPTAIQIQATCGPWLVIIYK